MHIYSRGPTWHIAWQFGNASVSFNKGKKTADIGSVELPSPSGGVIGRSQVNGGDRHEQDRRIHCDFDALTSAGARERRARRRTLESPTISSGTWQSC